MFLIEQDVVEKKDNFLRLPCPVATHRKSGNVEAVEINSAVLFLQLMHNFLH